MEGQEKKNGGLVTGVIVALVIAVAAYGFYSYSKKSGEGVSVNISEETTPTNVPVATATVVASNYMFKDGTYSSNGKYNSPAGSEEIGVTVTVKGDVITDASVKVLATNPVSNGWQTKVSEGIKSAVVGKKLTDVVLTKVSGSSLTPKAWNEAIAKIQVSAKA